MVLTYSVEREGQVVDETSVACTIIDDEHAVAIIGTVTESLTFRAVSLTAMIGGVSHVLWTQPVMSPMVIVGGGEVDTFAFTCSGVSEFDSLVLHVRTVVGGQADLSWKLMTVDSSNSAHFTFEGGVPAGRVITALEVYGRFDGAEVETHLLWSA